MKILEIKVFRGANYWAPVPVIRLLVEMAEPETRSTNFVPDFYEKLTAALPTLRVHHCSNGKAREFLERVREGTDLGHVLQHVALELQNMVGQELGCAAQLCIAADHGVELRPEAQQIVFQYEQSDIGIAAGKHAIRLVESFLAPATYPALDYPSKLKELFQLARTLSYGPSTRTLVTEAKRRDIPVQRLEESRDRVQLGRSTRALRSLLQLGYGKYQRRVWAPYISIESHLATDIALNKDLTNRLMRYAGLPVPQFIRVDDEEAAVAAACEIGYPVVLKPLDGNHGRGVGVNLCDEAAVRAHYPLALGETHTGSVLVETFLPGNTYRVLVVGGRAIAVTEEVPAHVVGDGSHTLRQLVELTNGDPRRGHGSESLLVRIRLDEVALALAREQGYGANDVPPAAKRVQLVRTAHISLGGISVDHTDRIHPYNAMIAEQAAQVVGLQIAGIDLVTPEIGRSLRETGGGICEVNAGPGLGLHAEPVVGKPRDVARPIIELLFPPNAPSRIPIAAVAGTSGRTMTCRIITHMLKSAGHRVGWASTHGVEIEDVPFSPSDRTGFESARLVLRNPAIDAAVIETTYEGILCSGLGYDRADVAVVTQISDHQWAPDDDRSLDLVRLNAVVANSAGPHGHVVLNADDEQCVEVGRQLCDRVVYYSASPCSPIIEKHVRRGGGAVVFLEGEGVFMVDGRGTALLLKSESSRVARALAAAAACVVLQIGVEHIREGLRSFNRE